MISCGVSTRALGFPYYVIFRCFSGLFQGRTEISFHQRVFPHSHKCSQLSVMELVIWDHTCFLAGMVYVFLTQQYTPVLIRYHSEHPFLLWVLRTSSFPRRPLGPEDFILSSPSSGSWGLHPFLAVLWVLRTSSFPLSLCCLVVSFLRFALFYGRPYVL